MLTNNNTTNLVSTDNLIKQYTAHLVLVTASVVYGLYKELAPEHEEECIPLPPFDWK